MEYYVTVTRVGTKTGYENDNERLQVNMPDANGQYHASFDGKIIHIEDGFCYVVKTDSSKALVKAKLTEVKVTDAAFVPPV